jgi:hypothetical protein
MKIKNAQGWIDKTKELINLPEYNEVIENIVKRIFDEGCDMMHYDQERSMHQVTIHDCMILLSTKTKNKLDILWELIHELGHHLDMDRNIEEDSSKMSVLRKAEIRAWKQADKVFDECPEVQHLKNLYTNYKVRSLKSYDLTLGDL